MAYANILVIGNGFDLAHHLPTQYSDFLDFVNAYKEQDNNVYSNFINIMKKDNAMLYSKINNLVKDNVLIDYFLSVYRKRTAEGKKGWIDFENEISTIVQRLDLAKKYIEKEYSASGELVKLEKGLARQLKHIFDNNEKVPEGVILGARLYSPQTIDHYAEVVLDGLNRLIKLLQIYLYDYVEKSTCKYRLPDLSEIGVGRVLSFNYTDTFKKYYDSDGKIDYCFIHGKTQGDDFESRNLVLGIDEYLPRERRDIDNQYVWFKKFYQRIYKETGSEYLDWIHNFEHYCHQTRGASVSYLNIYIYGHSLDVTDKDVLSRLIMMENTKTHIYYHNREALAKQIENLVKVIGEENLIRKTGGKERTIEFIQSQAAIKMEE